MASRNVAKASQTPRQIVRGAIRDLFNELAQYHDEAAANMPKASEDVKNAFREFLIKSDFKLALKNFDALLAEKSGADAYRDDGTVNWYHELVPILMCLDLVKMTKKNGGMDLKDVDRHGGLEVLIISHLRHDSAEDFISREELLNQMRDMCADLKRENKDHDVEKCQRQIDLSMKIIDLMTQKRLYNPDGSPKLRADGKQEKESHLDFTQSMVNREESHPFVPLLKLCDLTANGATLKRDEIEGPLAILRKTPNLSPENMSTLMEPSKFSPQKILERCDRMEDYFGPRFGVTGKAAFIWKEFEEAYKTVDHTMGVVLYPHFRYLMNVDLHYKESSDYPMGLENYMERATSWSLSHAFNPVHISIKRMINSVDPKEDPEKFERLERFKENVLKPTFAPWKRHFQLLYVANDKGSKNGHSHPEHHSAVA